MRIEIASTDRVGITQEILTVFAQQNWDLQAMEVSQNMTYLHLKDKQITLGEVGKKLQTISGLRSFKLIELLPGERREQQLQVLLAKIPEPIIDIDKHGKILMANAATGLALSLELNDIIGKSITKFVDLAKQSYASEQLAPQEVSFANQQYFAEITPVKADQEITGSVMVLRSLTNIGRQLSHLQKGQTSGFSAIIGQSSGLLEVINQAKRFAHLDLPVMITGETGTGKELLAKALHDNSNRATKPFLAINCAALPEHLLESELFGYASGAFTGARNSGKPGLFELAEGGTVFLDEIAEIPVYLQAKLLRFLQDYQVRRVGGITERKVDIRIISATHQQLLNKVKREHFREDLFYRLNVLSLHIPALRERKDDIEELVHYFLDNAAKQLNQTSVRLSALALNKIINYGWPGNIRQLQNTLFKIAALADSADINEHDFSLENELDDSTGGEAAVVDWQHAQQQFERHLLESLYPLYPTTRKLAKRLNVSHNKIAMKLREYNINQQGQ